MTLVSTRVTTLEFKGGFSRRYIDLKVDARGDFTQTERTASFPKPPDAADTAINTKIEGWEIPQELRADRADHAGERARSWSPRSAGRTRSTSASSCPRSVRSCATSTAARSRCREPDADGTIRQVDAADAGARHDRKPRRSGTGDPRARADRRTARGRRHQGNPARRIGDPAGTAARAPARATRRATCAPPTFRSRSRRSSGRRPSRPAPPPTSSATSSRRRSRCRPRAWRRTAGRPKATPSGSFWKSRRPARPRRPNVLGKDSVLKLQAAEAGARPARRAPRDVANLKLPQTSMSPAAASRAPAAVLGSFLKPAEGTEK